MSISSRPQPCRTLLCNTFLLHSFVMLTFVHLKQDYLALRVDLKILTCENERLREENARLHAMLERNSTPLSPHPDTHNPTPFNNTLVATNGNENELHVKVSCSSHAPDLDNHLITSMFSGLQEDENGAQIAPGVTICDASLGMSLSECILEQSKHAQTQLSDALDEVARLKAQILLEKENSKEDNEKTDDDEDQGIEPIDLRRSFSIKSAMSSSSRGSRLNGPLDRVSRRVQILKAFVKEQEA